MNHQQQQQQQHQQQQQQLLYQQQQPQELQCDFTTYRNPRPAVEMEFCSGVLHLPMVFVGEPPAQPHRPVIVKQEPNGNNEMQVKQEIKEEVEIKQEVGDNEEVKVKQEGVTVKQEEDSELVDRKPVLCIRRGCTNLAVMNTDWEDEYCSNECVVAHCRDVFGSFQNHGPS
uniref:Uncharacterized protein n=1 Tax=Anopheles atroparvus TaxID=41427 RepID=A0AAG5DX27_ANOAO